MSTVIELAGVSVVRGGNRLLSNISWQVEEDERWVVLGPNGAGKTTLLQVLSTHLYPTEGVVRVLGEVIGTVDVFDLRPRIGLSSVSLGDRVPRDPNAPVVPMMRAMGMINQLIWEGTFHDRFQDKAYAIEIFEKNTADVKKKVPAERLLVYEIQEGWEPLATFLGVPVPADKPFPRVNDTASFLDMIKRTQPGAAPSPIIP